MPRSPRATRRPVQVVRAWFFSRDGEDFRILYSMSKQVSENELHCIAEEFGLSLDRFTRILNRLIAEDY